MEEETQADDAAPRQSAGQGDARLGPVGVGDVLGGRYRLDKLLGSGGMGRVFVAEHLTLGVQVAVKVMHRYVALVEENVRRFAREAKAAMLLRHENVVDVLDFGEQDGTFFMVMELIDGEPFDAWLEQRQLAPLEEALPILIDVTEALSVAHERGIVHRDLKPDNVLVRPDGRAKVVDFGLVHLEDHGDDAGTLTKVDSIAGTPAYMSPEQCRSLAVGPSTDLYALGCMLTTVLQGKPPFVGRNAMDTMASQMLAPPPPLDRPADAPPVPQLLESLRTALLSKQPHKRPPHAAAVRATLLEVLEVLDEGAAGALRPRHRRSARPPSHVSEPPAAQSEVAVTLLRLASVSADGVADTCRAALTAGGISMNDASASDKVTTDLVILDGGLDFDGARSEAKRLMDAGKQVVVCVDGLDATRLSTLIGDGVKDAVRYPVHPDLLVKKLRRITRRSSK